MNDPAYRRARLFLLITTWLLYALTADGTLSVDPLTRFDVAANLVRYGDLAQPEQGIHTVEHDGEHFSVFFPGQSILFLPSAAAGTWVADLLGVDPDVAVLGSRFVTSVFVMPCFGVLALLGHLAILRTLRVGPRVALGSAAVLAFGTPLWVWACSASEEPGIGVLAVWAFWAILEAGRVRDDESLDDGRRHERFANRLGLAAVLLAAGMLHRATFVTVVLGASILVVPILLRNLALLRKCKLRLLVWALLTLLVLAIIPLYNWARFDDPFDTGYAAFYESIGGIWGTPMLMGLRGHLLSPGKSVFLYVPWLLLLPLAMIAGPARRRLGLLSVALLVAVTCHLLIYSKYTYWSGAFGWGVRFHVSFYPLLLVPIAVWIDGLRPTRLLRIELAIVAVVSMFIQVIGNSLNYGLEYRQHPEHYSGWGELIPEDAAWTWRGSQIRLRLINIQKKLSGHPLLPLTGADDPERIVTVWHIFPPRAAEKLDRPDIVRLLWLFWWLLVAASAATIWMSIAAYRRVPP